MLAAGIIVTVVGAYLAVGIVFALWFVLRGVHLLDRAAAGSHWGFRVLIVPGVAALWPVLALKVTRAAQEREP